MKRILIAVAALALVAAAGAQQINLATQVKGQLPLSAMPSGVTQTIATGATALGTSAIASGACATVVTASASGVLSTDVVAASFNGSPIAVTGFIPSTSGTLTIIPYPSAGAVNFVECNLTAASITPGAVTLNWRVTR